MSVAPEVLVTIQLSFPVLDRPALAAQIAPVMQTAVAAGGLSTSISVQPFDPSEVEDL